MTLDDLVPRLDSLHLRGRERWSEKYLAYEEAHQEEPA